MSNMEQAPSLGVTIQLPAETAESLRSHAKNGSKDKSTSQVAHLTNISANSLHSSNIDKNEEQEDWNDLLVMDGPIHDDESDLESDKDNDDGEEHDDDDLSYSPPPTLPVVLIDLDRLVGYRPSTEEEAVKLQEQVNKALWWGSDDGTPPPSNPQDDESSGLLAQSRFDERVAELFEAGVAIHSKTDNSNNNSIMIGSKFVSVSYPDFLCTITEKSRVVLSTERVWKRLVSHHPIPVVQRLFQHLSRCNRSLLWKHAMHQELYQLAKREEQARIDCERKRELDEWRTNKRKQDLEKLYQVRETMDHQVEMARLRKESLEKERDARVTTELRKRRQASSMGGLEAFDFASTILSLPSTGTIRQSSLLGLEDDYYYDEEMDDKGFSSSEEGISDYGGADDSEDNSYLGDEDIDYEDGEAKTATPDMPVSTTTSRDPVSKTDRIQRRKKAAKTRRRRLEEARKEAEHGQKLLEAQAQEEQMRELCTTSELKMAQAIFLSLEQRMQKVDDLLESLQEEEWADEEEAERNNGATTAIDAQKGRQNDLTKEPTFSLLDQVLAMILGSMKPGQIHIDESLMCDDDSWMRLDQSVDPKDFQQVLGREHQSLVQDWRDYFGRLPPPFQMNNGVNGDNNITTESSTANKNPETEEASESRQAELRDAYGIIENDDDDWDANDSDQEGKEEENVNGMAALSIASREQIAPTLPINKPPAKGLRPGGKVRR